MTDDDLMRTVAAGDREAFATLFDRYREPIWRFFRRRVAEWSAAEELTQETFLAVLQRAARYEPRAAFRSYLFGIAFNLLAAARRRGSTPGGHHARSLDEAGPVPAAPVAFDDILDIRQALANLDPRDRDILMLREYDALSYDEISAVIGVPVGTVRSRLFRAREALRQRLEARSAPQEAAR
jgi:RNA polymerase sigma-70 factor, ECF subfamily